MATIKRLARALPLLLISPFLILTVVFALALTDLAWFLFGRRIPRRVSHRRSDSATVVIPNWNGRALLAQYLPPLIEALHGNSNNEIIVVDNGSTDGSAEFVRRAFPRVNLLALEKNLGFGGGSNAGFRAAKNDIVVLLNSDMRVERGFLAPLLEAFTDENVFSVGCQIFFSDPQRVREETGLTQGWWQDGALRVRHRIDETISEPYPCFYGGGGSTAFDRAKFLELGGFDSLLAPFYMEDTDLGYLAWKRGWKVLYQPRSIVYHEHRGTIGKHFSEAYIQAVLKKNFILFCWKNIHQWRRLASHFFFMYFDGLLSLVVGDSPERASLEGLWRAFRQLPGALKSRANARSLATIGDAEALRRPMGGYFRDRFASLDPDPAKLRVLFVSPYPIYPPVHGGGVFMYQTLTRLVRHSEVHLIALLDYPHQLAENECLRKICASAEFLVRIGGGRPTAGSIVPHAVREFANEDLRWLIHRQIYTRRIDVVQLEYTNMGQYAEDFRAIPNILFEHDIYFQSIARGLRRTSSLVKRCQAYFEYLRALRYELRLLPAMDRIQVCSRPNRDYLLSFAPQLKDKLQDGLRAGIDTSRYCFNSGEREPYTMLFLGGFRHVPNQIALDWFLKNVMPLVLARRPEARLIVVGSDPPPRHGLPGLADAVELRGFVEDVREPLSRYSVFLCPILSGSGVRVKLLEAFAAGMPVVSTRLGAEGLSSKGGEVCCLADDPATFAESILKLFENPGEARDLARRAREEVVGNWDMSVLAAKLSASYHEAVREKRAALREEAGS
jgi:GT2 family glycosyltransferase/glycosyltransferase involved in cell wall biosynthesis